MGKESTRFNVLLFRALNIRSLFHLESTVSGLGMFNATYLGATVKGKASTA